MVSVQVDLADVIGEADLGDLKDALENHLDGERLYLLADMLGFDVPDALGTFIKNHRLFGREYAVERLIDELKGKGLLPL